MNVESVIFVGTRTTARADMSRFVRHVLGLRPTDSGGMDADLFALPDGSSFAVTSPDAPDDTERTIGFLVSDVVQAAAELRAAGIATSDEASSSAHQRYIHFRAPDGHLYELVENIS